jgi:hypothetical protein
MGVKHKKAHVGLRQATLAKAFGREAILTKYPHALPIEPRREPRALLMKMSLTGKRERAQELFK